MNNVSTLGVIASFVMSVSLNGSSATVPSASEIEEQPIAYVVNHSHSTVYYKPESVEDNPGLDQRGVYEIGPGQSLFSPVDAVATNATGTGNVYKIPTGGKVVINESGMPEPSNLIAKAGILLPFYGNVKSPSEGFAMLANAKMVIYQLPDTRK